MTRSLTSMYIRMMPTWVVNCTSNASQGAYTVDSVHVFTNVLALEITAVARILIIVTAARN